MSDQQKDADDSNEVSPGTALFIGAAILLIPLLFAGFLFQ